MRIPTGDTRRHADTGRRNMLKMRVFAFLKLRQENGANRTRVKMIRDGTGENLQSLHVSVLKWTAWGYLQPYLMSDGRRYYELTQRGLDYYKYMTTKSLSAERYVDLEADILRTASTAFYWVQDGQPAYVHAIVSPYSNQFCVRSQLLIGDITPRILKGILICIRKPNALEAIKAVDKLFPDIGGDMTDEMVRRGWIRYTDQERTAQLRAEGKAQEAEQEARRRALFERMNGRG